MRSAVALGAALVVVLLAAVPGRGLERAARAAGDLDRPGSDGWTRGCWATIAYYNICTGWIWAWSGWGPGERAGVAFVIEWCTDNAHLSASWHYAATGNPAGYGYTGTMRVQAADPGLCPIGAPLQSQPLLPVTGWNALVWQVSPVPIGCLLLWTCGPVAGAPVAWATDHPAAGASGPPACGSCYPTARTTHSFRYGNAANPECPGIPFDDGTACAPELLWDVDGVFAPWISPTVAVGEGYESRSWGSVKSLYR